MGSTSVLGPAALLALLVLAALGSARAEASGFGFQPGAGGFVAHTIADGGGPANLAGSHPDQIDFAVDLDRSEVEEGQPVAVDGDLRDLDIQMPPGLILNPLALPRCGAAAFALPRSSPFEASVSGESCPDGSQVGVAEVETGGGQVRSFGVFNLRPPAGSAAEIGFSPFGSPIVMDADLQQADGSYTLTLGASDIPQSLDVQRLAFSLWGVPRGASHNKERGNCLNELDPSFPWSKCSVGPPRFSPLKAYVTLPGRCGGPLVFTATIDSWKQAERVSASAEGLGSEGSPASLDCSFLGFASHPVGLLTAKNASTASGFEFRLTNEAEGLVNPDLRAPSQVKDAVVELPEGATLNPSVGAGLAGCTPGQYAAETAFSTSGQGCPNAARIGEFRVHSPLFEEWFEGNVYLAQPDRAATSTPGAENPFDTMVALYLIARIPQRGILIELAGKAVPDPRTGRLVATFKDLPQLPYDDLQITFRSGERAPLITPPSCGSHPTQIQLSAWGGVVSTASYSNDSTVGAGIGGGACPTGATPPFAPVVEAGGSSVSAGVYTPFSVHLSRKDTEQEITSYSVVLPRGITGKLAGVRTCSDAAIAAARGKLGAEETAKPSCPASSEIGQVTSGYGVGPALTYAPGKVYLAGPYHGKPLSLVTIDAATVGPFDLGTIVIRSAFEVDPITAQLRIDSRASDPIPHILDGIPLHLRDIRIAIDRPQFTRNPTSCQPSQLVSTLTGAGARFDDPGDDSTAVASSRFQLISCRELRFRPKLGLRLLGGSRRGDYPSLRAVFASGGPEDANLKQIAVTMPHSLFLAQNHIRSVCTREQFARENCPAASVYGHAAAVTQLFDEPLRGPIYLRSSSHRLPDLVASLRSGAVHIVLTGRIGPSRQGIRTVFSNLPDAPVSRFVMTLRGGKKGLLVNSANVCAVPPFAKVKAVGQNDHGVAFKSKLRGQCDKSRDKRKGKR